MKIAIILLWILFIFAIIIEADVRRKARTHISRNAELGTVCIEGYKFAFLQANGNNGVALVQIMRKGNIRSIPMRCK